jgi:hypothetical protein
MSFAEDYVRKIYPDVWECQSPGSNPPWRIFGSRDRSQPALGEDRQIELAWKKAAAPEIDKVDDPAERALLFRRLALE